MTKITTFNFSIDTPNSEERILNNKEFVVWGEKNQYPEFLYELYKKSAEHQSIVDGLVQYTLGNGIKSSNPNVQLKFDKINKDEETINDIASKLLLDYYIFGGFSSQIIPARDKSLAEIYWTDFMNCRINEDEDKVFYSKNWTKYRPDVKVYDEFNVEEKQTASSIYYFKGLKTRGFYPVPLYNAAITAIQTSVEIDNFHLNNVSNGFQASTIINFNNGEPDEDTKKEIEKALDEKFNGTSGKKFMIIYNESKDTAITIEKLDADNFDEQFDTLQKSVQNRIFVAHKVTSPALFGIKMENTGFSKTEYEESFDIFNNTIIKSYQKILITELEKMLKPFYGKDLGIFIEPYKLQDDV